MSGLKIFRGAEKAVYLDLAPSGSEEEENLYGNPVNDPRDLNKTMIAERMQNMGERIY